MHSERKYIVKGVLYTCVLIALVYAAYHTISYKKNKIVAQPPVITHEDLLNMPEVAKGKELFDKSCSACHKIYAKDGSNFQDIVNGDYTKEILWLDQK